MHRQAGLHPENKLPGAVEGCACTECHPACRQQRTDQDACTKRVHPLHSIEGESRLLELQHIHLLSFLSHHLIWKARILTEMRFAALAGEQPRAESNLARSLMASSIKTSRLTAQLDNVFNE